MKTLATRVLRAVIRNTTNIIRKVDPVSGNFSDEAFSYAAINSTLAMFMSEDAHILRTNYTWGVLQAAHLAHALNVQHLSVIEFGVAGGDGLVALERAAQKTEALLDVKIDVHGFDTGRGLPKSNDYRDLPNCYSESQYVMDVDQLRDRLRSARLHIGLVADTITTFIASSPPPIGFIAFDLDYYSSTVDAFTILEADEALLLPRVHCYFDDIMGFTCSEFTGERLAIDEFNSTHRLRKISPIFGLKYFLRPDHGAQQWSEMFYLAHIFDHPLYGQPDGLVRNAQRPLKTG
jgi:hypothetical protein